MSAELESGRAALEPETVSDLIELNDRINSTQDLISKHTLLSPLFKFLEASTVKNVRFEGFNFGVAEKGLLKLSMRGQARSYSALASQAEIFNQSKILKDITFSDLTLDEKSNVIFSFDAVVDEAALSYERTMTGAPVVVPVPVPKLPTTATSTATATTTSKVSTSSPKTTQ